MTEHLPECCVGKLTEEWQRGVTAGRVLGYADALDAAREAVAALRGCIGTDDSGDGTVWVEKINALSAIDALREGDQP